MEGAAPEATKGPPRKKLKKAAPAPAPLADPAPVPPADPAPVPPADPAPVLPADPAPVPTADPAPAAKKTKGRRKNKLNVDIEMADPAATASAAPPPPVKSGRGRTRKAAPTDAVPAPPPPADAATPAPPPPADAATSHPHFSYACCGILNARISHLENFVVNLLNEMRNDSKELTKSVNNLEVRLSHMENYLEGISADTDVAFLADQQVIPAIEVVDATPEVSEEEADMMIDPTLLQ